MIAIKILSNNQTQRPGILAEHGLSLFVQVDDQRILFDTGQSNLAHNAASMGLDLASISALVISHGHYDHTGGVEDFARQNKQAKIFIHPEAFCQRFNKGKKESLGVPWQAAAFSERIVPVVKPLSLAPDILLTGQVARFQEITQTPFLKLVGASLVDDYVLDEQLMLVRGRGGIYIFVGCCHMGIANALGAVQYLFPGEKIAAVIGGLHLTVSGKEAGEQLRNCEVELVVPLHCTGSEAVCDLKEALGDRCLLSGAGEELVLEP
jgi:7,8-dihydropterin-6-yl-methyl-4-(beta-D-ribofuranosyl)aminobenzene 5'-phosphate synthase